MAYILLFKTIQEKGIQMMKQKLIVIVISVMVLGTVVAAEVLALVHQQFARQYSQNQPVVEWPITYIPSPNNWWPH